MCKIIFVILFIVILFPLYVNAAWDDFAKTEKLLQQLNETTDKLVEVSKSNAELSHRILELTQSNKESSEKMESLTKQITILTWILAIFALIQITLEIFDRKKRRTYQSDSCGFQNRSFI